MSRKLKIERTFDETMLRSFIAAKYAVHAATIPTTTTEVGGVDPAHSSVPVTVPVFELRILHADWSRSGHIVPAERFSKNLSGWYDNLNSLVVDAKSLEHVSAYLTANPVNPDLRSRATNRLSVAKQGFATADVNIPALHWLYLDCDSVRPDGISATQSELAAALGLRDRLLAEVGGLAASSLWGCSGNGGWIQVCLPGYPNDDRHIDLCRQFLLTLTRQYSDEKVRVDRKTSNPSRIAALPGTLKCKGDHSPERPWRLVTLDSPEGQADDAKAARTLVPFDLAGWVAEHAGPEVAAESATPPKSSTRGAGISTAGTTGSEHGNRMARAAAFVASIPGAIAGQGGHDQTFSVATALVKGFDLDISDARSIFAAYNTRCVPPWSEAELDHKLTDAAAKSDDQTRGYLYVTDKRQGAGSGGTYDAHPEIPKPHYERHIGEPGSEPGLLPQVDGNGKPLVVKEADDDPHRLARVILGYYTQVQANSSSRHCRLAHFRDDFYAYEGNRYCLKPDFQSVDLVHKIKADLDIQAELALKIWKMTPPDERGKEPKAIRVTRALVADVAQALAAMTSIDRHMEPPFWRIPATHLARPTDVIPVANGLLDISGTATELEPHTPNYFCTYVLPYAYDPSAAEPKLWLKLLQDQWVADRESIDTLHEQLGYLLTPDTSLQKLFLWIGPPRSGRSTIKDILSGLIGHQNVGATSAVALSNSFGLESLLNRTVAIMGDARTSDTHDHAIMVDRLLRITGCDPVDVNRKNRPILANLLLPLRFVVVSNELPMFRDASNAITTRYLILKTNRTIPAEERVKNLARRILAAELPGILNLAIEGLQRLRARGRFLQPMSAMDLLEDAEDIASPIKSFVLECLMIDPEADMLADDGFAVWRSWSHANGFSAGNKNTFGKNLRAACPKIQRSRPKYDPMTRIPLNEEPEPGTSSKRAVVYTGIGLNEEGLERLAKIKERGFKEDMKGGMNSGMNGGFTY